MMCGPVLIQWFAPVGLAAYGSVLLASVPPSSMYMNPTLPTVGAVWPAQAWTQSMAFLSIHMGSGPGVAGLSGIQVNPFVPLRSVRILPSASMVPTVAFLATLAGAALMALLIRSASLGAAFFSCAFAMRHRASAAQATPLAITL